MNMGEMKKNFKFCVEYLFLLFLVRIFLDCIVYFKANRHGG
jgi:hypothetical protein